MIKSKIDLEHYFVIKAKDHHLSSANIYIDASLTENPLLSSLISWGTQPQTRK